MTPTATQVEIPAGFVVVDVERDGAQYCYSMDFKPEYQAFGHRVRVFNPATCETRTVDVPWAQWSEDFAEVDTAARDQWEAMVKERAEWTGWFHGLLKLVDDADQCKPGTVVEVYKGRKCPKGVYTVVERFTSTYGPTSHLKAANGTVTRFVNPDNYRVHDLKNVRRKLVIDDCPEGHGETVWAFLFADSPTGEFSAEKLPILCDYIEDGLLGEVPPHAGQWIRERFCK